MSENAKKYYNLIEIHTFASNIKKFSRTTSVYIHFFTQVCHFILITEVTQMPFYLWYCADKFPDRKFSSPVHQSVNIDKVYKIKWSLSCHTFFLVTHLELYLVVPGYFYPLELLGISRCMDKSLSLWNNLKSVAQ